MAAHDVDRQVSAYARESWDRIVSVSAHDPGSDSQKRPQLQLEPGSEAFAHLWDFSQRVLLDPAGVYAYVTPPQPVVPNKQAQAGKGASTRNRREDDPPSRSGREEEEENEEDRRARLRISGFGVINWVLSECLMTCSD